MAKPLGLNKCKLRGISALFEGIAALACYAVGVLVLVFLVLVAWSVRISLIVLAVLAIVWALRWAGVAI